MLWFNAWAVYNSSIEVPDSMSLEEAVKYAADHLQEIPMGALSYVADSDSICEEDCSFDQ